MAVQKAKILLIDDDHFFLDLYALKFKNTGFDVDISANPEEALEKFRSGSVYDVVLMDIIMPNLDGFDLMKSIRDEKLLPKASFIILTNNSEDTEKMKVFNVDGYIVKATMIPSEVVEKVSQIWKEKFDKQK